MSNYFNQLALRQQLEQLGQCRFMDASEFDEGIGALEGKKNRNCRLWSAGVESGTQYERFRIEYCLCLAAGSH